LWLTICFGFYVAGQRREEIGAMRATFDTTDEAPGEGGPFVSEADVIGLYRPDIAAAASKATACDPGSGPVRIDD
jgi:hypothetical protein